MAANIGSKLEMKDIFTSEQNLTGSVERVLFYSSDNGYCVLRVKCRKNQNSVIVTANIPHVTVGENIECYGEWIVHPKFGEQFKASQVITQKPTDKDAIEKYLASGVISGIGEVYAQKLVAVFGDTTLEALEKAATSTESAIPEKLVQEALDVTGKTWHNIKEGIVEYLEKYKKQAAAYPYPIIFVTADAVVMQAGHVLMVQRGADPGNGLWALPGGFVDATGDRTMEDAALRELREETGIKVPEKVLRGSIRGNHVFAAPDRSQRGRTITHAIHIALEDGEWNLPKVKGSDDAARAKWIPISRLNSEEIFEDHYDIIQYFLGK